VKYVLTPVAIVGIAILALITSCKQPVKPVLTEEQLEAHEDSLAFLESKAWQKKITFSVTADGETHSVTSPNVADDAADDMAVWVNLSDPEKSIIVGSNKKGGVVLFDLKGKELAFYPTGRINNIDVTYGFPTGKQKIDLVGCTNRTEQSINLYQILPDGTLKEVAARKFFVDTNLVKDVYGFCFYKSKKHYLFLNGKNGMVQQFELIATDTQTVDIQLVRQFSFQSQTEGMVADELYKVLYIGEEDKGIWKISAEPDGGNQPEFVLQSGEDNPNIRFDVEGLAISKKQDSGYLIASSQGNFSYAVFDRKPPNKYLFSFKVVDGPDYDGVEETDGIEVVQGNLGDSFPNGMFLAQDGYNFDKDKLQRQNFKMVRWEKIELLYKPN
jgi:3-phytase